MVSDATLQKKLKSGKMQRMKVGGLFKVKNLAKGDQESIFNRLDKKYKLEEKGERAVEKLHFTAIKEKIVKHKEPTEARYTAKQLSVMKMGELRKIANKLEKSLGIRIKDNVKRELIDKILIGFKKLRLRKKKKEES